MTMAPVRDWLVPDELAPSPTGGLAPLYAAGAKGSLVMPFCGACGMVLELEQVTCDACGSSGIEWRPVDRSGTVHTVTTVHRLEPGLVLTKEPYQVADVELASGHRIIMTTEGPTQTPLRIGDHVSIAFRTIGDVAVPAVAVPSIAVAPAAEAAPTTTDGDAEHRTAQEHRPQEIPRRQHREGSR